MGRLPTLLRRAGQVGIGIGIAALTWAAVTKDTYFLTWGTLIVLGSIGTIRYSHHIHERDEQEHLQRQLRDERMQEVAQQNPGMSHIEWIRKEYEKLTKRPE